MAFIYKVTNIMNGKIYVGKSKFNDPLYYGSGLQIIEAIKKYGKNNFIKTIIEECDHDQVNEREKYWITKLQSTDRSIGYNISKGGDGGTHYWSTLTEEQRREHNSKISKSKQGKSHAPHSEETKRKISSSYNRSSEIMEKRRLSRLKQFTCVNHNTGEVFFTKNISQFCKDHNLNCGNMLYNARTKKNYTENSWSCRKEKLEGSSEDIIQTIVDEINLAQQKIKKARGWDRRGDKNPMFNKKHSAETIKKLKEIYVKNRKNSN